MTADVVNLRAARKARARAARKDLAAQNRARFGQTKADRLALNLQRRLDAQRLDGAKREKRRETDPYEG